MGTTTNRSGWLVAILALCFVAVAATLGWLAVENHRLGGEVSSLKGELATGVSQIERGHSVRETATSARIDEGFARIDATLASWSARETATSARIDEGLARVDATLASSSVRETATSARIDEGFARIGETFASWSTGIAAEMRLDQSNMNAVLNRALGKVIPVVLPEDYESKLKSLESQVADESRWPASWVDAQSFMEQTAALVRGLPSWAEADYLPRLTPIRWAAAAFVICNVDAAKVPQEQTARDAQELVDVAPTLVSEGLRAHLQALVVSMNEAVAKSELERAVRDARAVIDGSTDGSAIGAASSADAILQANLGASDPGVDLEKLRADLRVSIIRAQAAEEAKGLGLRWERLRGMQASDPSLFEAGAQTTLMAIANARVALAAEGLTTAAYDSVQAQVKSALSGLAKDRESRRDAAVRAYQRWALNQIDAFDSRFAAAEAQANKDGSMFKIDNGGWSPERLREVRVAMSECLIPINLMLLEPPVQKLFERAFEKGWKQLDGDAEQVEVAKASAIVEKKSLGVFFEGGNQ